MKCPYCGYQESRVVDSRPTDDNERIRRRRECLRCQRRFTTYEAVETVPIIVIKKSGMQEPFACCGPAKSARSRWNRLNRWWIPSKGNFKPPAAGK